MKTVYNLRCYATNDEDMMLFCPNWSGLGLLTSGYEGSSVEPFHTAWEQERKNIAHLAVKHSSLEILTQMQYLYDNSFGDWYGWNNPSKHALSLYPVDYDPAHLNGASLTAAGIFHAQALWLASQGHAVHFEVLSSNADLPGHYDPRHTQVVAVVMDASKPVVAADAEHGAKTLFSSGDELRQRLLDAGLLEEMRPRVDEEQPSSAPNWPA